MDLSSQFINRLLTTLSSNCLRLLTSNAFLNKYNHAAINARTLTLEEFTSPISVPYTILSHTWQDEELEATFEDMQQGPVAASLKKWIAQD